MKIGAIIQARASGTRLPGKIFKDLPYGSGISVLQHVIRRVARSKEIDTVIVATTKEKQDDATIKIAQKEGVGYFRGDTKNVLSRFYGAASRAKLDMVVRICADCPCIDAKIIDDIIVTCVKQGKDYVSNTLKQTYPLGLNAEALTYEALVKAHQNASEDFQKEHVTPYIYQNPRIFKIGQVVAPRKLHGPDIRLTLDRDEDLALLNVIYESLYSRKKFFDAGDVIRLYREKPWLKIINRNMIQKNFSISLNDEIKQAINILDLQEFHRAGDVLRHSLKDKKCA